MELSEQHKLLMESEKKVFACQEELNNKEKKYNSMLRENTLEIEQKLLETRQRLEVAYTEVSIVVSNDNNRQWDGTYICFCNYCKYLEFVFTCR